MSHLIGIDLGATNAKAAVVTKDGKVIANVQESLGKDLSPKAVVSKLCKVCVRRVEGDRNELERDRGRGCRISRWYRFEKRHCHQE